MTEHVVHLDLGVTWEPNAPDAVLVSTDDGRSMLALNPHPNDQDRRTVVLVWDGCAAALQGAPNDEARHLHRLHDFGLGELLWLGVVEGSQWAATVEQQQAGSPRRHFVVLTKETTVEVLAVELSVVRATGPTAEAVASLM